MRARSALVVAGQRRAVAGVAGDGPQEEELRGAQLALEDVALRQARGALDVERRHDLTVQDDLLQVGHVLGQGVDDHVAQLLAALVPGAPGELVGRVLDEARQHVLARRRHVGIDRRGHDDVEVGPPREVAVLGVVVGALEVVDRGADRDRAPQVRPVARHAGEVGSGVERQVDLGRGAAEAEAAEAGHQIVGQRGRVHELEERAARIEAGRDDPGPELVAVLQRDAPGPSPLDDHLRHGGVGADLGARLAGRAGDRVGDGARAALREAPRPVVSVDLAHVVVEQHVGGARRTRAQERSDDPARRDRRLQRVGLEPLVDEVGGAHRHQLDEQVQLLGLEAEEVPAEAHQAGRFASGELAGIGRSDREERLDGARHVEERASVVVVGLGVAGGEAGDLAPRAVVVGVPVQAAAAGERSQRALERQDAEPVPGQVQLPDDVGAHQADDVGEDAVLEARKDLLGDRGAAHERTPLEDAHLEARAREVGGVDEAVVAPSDDDRVVAPRCHQPRFLGGSKKGVLVTVADTLWRTNSTVSSTRSRVPGAANGRRSVASATNFLRTGENVELVM